ncbi:MAG: hypothetical protein ISS55_11070 [Dehalococcoidales bacterium]|nr:hypothetical protein [Dehalococcoidales bacterium]
MAFRLPASLGIGGQYQPVSPGDVAVLEEALPPRSRVLVGLVFAERYDGFLEDCEQAEAALREAGIPAWPEYNHLVTPDPDGEPVAWISYQSSPVFWTPILLIIGGIFLLPILSSSAMWLIEHLFPGATDIINMVVMLVIIGGVMKFMPKSEKR